MTRPALFSPRTLIMVLAPLSIVVGTVLDPTGEPDDQRFLTDVHRDLGAYTVSTVLLTVGLALMTVAASGTRELAADRASRLLGFGRWFTMVGGVAGAASTWMFGVTHVVASDPALGAESMHAFVTKATDSPIALVPAAAGFLLLAAGSALIGIGVWCTHRYGALGVAAAVLLCAFAVASIVLDLSGPLGLVRDLPLLLGYVLLVVALRVGAPSRRSGDGVEAPHVTV